METYNISMDFSLEWELFQGKSRVGNKTHILCSKTFFFENRALYPIMWKNMLKPERQKMIIRRMRFVYWLIEAIGTHSEYVTCIALFHSNNGKSNASQFYFIGIQPFLFDLLSSNSVDFNKPHENYLVTCFFKFIHIRIHCLTMDVVHRENQLNKKQIWTI